MAILIESALPLTVFGLAYAPFLVVPLPQSNGAFASFLVAYNTLNTLFYMFCVSASNSCFDVLQLIERPIEPLQALSPHMIIFRVTTGRSWLRFPLHTPGSSESSGVTNPIDFAHRNHTVEESLVELSAEEKPTEVAQVVQSSV
jgi:hypothetical protein